MNPFKGQSKDLSNIIGTPEYKQKKMQEKVGGWCKNFRDGLTESSEWEKLRETLNEATFEELLVFLQTVTRVYNDTANGMFKQQILDKKLKELYES